MRRFAVPAPLLFLLGGVAGAQPRRHGRFGSPDENDVRQAVESMNSLWNRGDARNYAAALSDDTDFENAAGWRIRSRAGVEQFRRAGRMSKVRKSKVGQARSKVEGLNVG